MHVCSQVHGMKEVKVLPPKLQLLIAATIMYILSVNVFIYILNKVPENKGQNIFEYFLSAPSHHCGHCF